MEALMNRGEGCVVPALVYLFNFIEKKFDGRLTMLVLDEAWLFLKNETFADKIAEWLKVLRKKNVYVVFATQDVADVANSPLKTTIMQQCFTKIYLADPQALSPTMRDVYRQFGLTDSEIALIASSRMKRDYFYTSPMGRRLFQLNLGTLTLALIGTPDHKLLDELAERYEPGTPLCKQILDTKRVKYKHLLSEDAPQEPEPKPRAAPIPASASAAAPKAVGRKEAAKDEIPTLPYTDTTASGPEEKNAAFMDAVASLPERKGSAGSGRAAETIAKEFGVAVSTVYQVRKIIKTGSNDLIQELRHGIIPFKTA
jgi:hypothetical protein